MKQFLLTLTALICMSMTAQAQTVYISNSSSAVAYHKSKSCSYLQNSKDVKSVSTSEAKKMGRHECQRCYGTATATTKKTTTAAEKKATATKKATTTAAEKKTTTTKKSTTTATKSTTPARDEKGRFIKTTDQKSTTTAKKSTSTKKTADKKSTTTAKKTTDKKTTTKKTADKKTTTKKSTTTKKKTTTKKSTDKEVKKAA